MPFDRDDLRLERVNVDMAYDSAFRLWNLKGVLAERWGHGPVFGAWTDAGQQVNLSPLPTEDEPDVRITGMYGIRISSLLAEGPRWTPAARELTVQWLHEVREVLAPRRVTRISAQLFGLYPVNDAEQASRRLRSRYYRSESLNTVLPTRLRGHQDHFHAAINLIVPDGDHQCSVIVGIVGPIHAGGFFAYSDAERDRQWWMGVNCILVQTNNEAGIDDPDRAVTDLVANAYADFEHAAATVLRDVIP